MGEERAWAGEFPPLWSVGLARQGDTPPDPARASLVLAVALLANAAELLCMEEKYLVTGSFLYCGFL